MARVTKAADPAPAARLAAIDHARGIISDLAPGRSLADELVAERRAAAAREQQDARSRRRPSRR